MAVTAPHYQIVKELVPILPRGGSLLEIGEANWYGDIEPDFPCQNKKDLFAIAKDFYAATLAPERITSIDRDPTRQALKIDLNDEAATSEAIRDNDFDIVINHGTAEHIFNIGQVFRTMHDACDVGGVMIHDCPFQGWIDHGFYCLQPTLFYDLARANNYEVMRVYVTGITPPLVLRVNSREEIPRLVADGKIPQNAMLFVVLKKLFDTRFKIPTQGYYDGTLGPQGKRAWAEAR